MELPQEFCLIKNYLLVGKPGVVFYFSHLCITIFAMIPRIEIITAITSMLFEINSIATPPAFDKWFYPCCLQPSGGFTGTSKPGGNYLVKFQ